MKTIGNILWLSIAGIWIALGYLVAGLLCCLTVVGFPLGLQAFKLAGFALWPMGRVAIKDPKSPPVSALGNLIWFLLGGWWLVVVHLVAALLLMLTVIGIPFGLQAIKLAGLALFRSGAGWFERRCDCDGPRLTRV